TLSLSLGFFQSATQCKWKQLLFIPFFLLFVMSVTANSMIIFIILSHRALHSPMYLLICVMAFVDLVIAISFVPNMLLNLLFNWNHISLMGCLVQMFCIHFFTSSTVLLAMALDRLVAICNPLRYVEIVNTAALVKFVALTLIRSGLIMSILVALARSLTFCSSNIIRHSYCDHMALVSLACGNKDKNDSIGLAVIVVFVGIDISIIAVSYMRILSVVLHAAEVEDRWKAFHTCSTHLLVIMSFYLVGSVTFLSHNIGIDIATDINTFLGILYIIFPATVNPITYGVWTKEIRNYEKEHKS
uniref:Odorant receptor, family 55, subfamily E, member 1 n=1 Tax=Scleropages formosus TaxID=113540 RepID=A0A8C9STR1_SCLFO